MNTKQLSSKDGSKVGRKLNILTNIKKKELYEFKITNPTKTNKKISKKFRIGKSTVGDILKEKAKWLAISLNATPEYGIEIPTLNILNVIDWVAESWKNVTEDLLDNKIEIEDKIVQLLIDQMIIDNAVIRAEDYIDINNILVISDMFNDDEIIAAVQEIFENEGEDEDENEILMISNKVTLESIQNLYDYL
ncbi:10742_t:CDS:2 [Ambispora leptoticha]|uniref:10742_t:CDS:1 n=1 Tax=Ambispora leptoticha TaxID=144679 RepID=A0A9N9GAL6_9GLOM|nr:10742_t:CDS:2 [Ambispora leptoticha]